MKVYCKTGGAILIIGLFIISFWGCVHWISRLKDSDLDRYGEIRLQEKKKGSLYWEDRQSGMAFDYPGGFEAVRKKNSVVLIKSENTSLKVFVFLNPDFLAQDNAEVYDQMRWYRENLVSIIEDPSLKMILPTNQTRLYNKMDSGIEILCVDDDVTLLKEKECQKGQLKIGYGCFDGLGVAVGYLGSSGNLQEYREGENCMEMILNSLKQIKYQGSPQLMIPEDIVFEKRTFFKGEIRIPQGWREYKLSEKALCFRPDPLRGDKLSGLKIIGAIWKNRNRKIESGYEDRVFLLDYEETIGSLFSQGDDKSKIKAIFYQNERQWINQNGRDWTIVEGFFKFEPQEEPMFSIANHQALICYSQNDSSEESVIIFLWDQRTGSSDAKKIAHSVLENFQ